MNVASILSKAYRLTNTSSVTFLDGNSTNILAELNTQYGHRVLNILNVRTDINSFISEVYTDLVSSSGLVAGDTGFNGEYPFPTTLMRPILAEVSYNGTDWYPATVYDIKEKGTSEHNQTQIQTDFSETDPYVRFERDSYFIRPLKTTSGNITGGIHLWYEKRQTDMTTGSPDFETNLHDILAYDLANQEYLMHPSKYTPAWRSEFKEDWRKIEDLFDEFYKNRFKKDLHFNEYNSRADDFE